MLDKTKNQYLQTLQKNRMFEKTYDRNVEMFDCWLTFNDPARLTKTWGNQLSGFSMWQTLYTMRRHLGNFHPEAATIALPPVKTLNAYRKEKITQWVAPIIPAERSKCTVTLTITGPTETLTDILQSLKPFLC